jgi:hypothetical protein
LSEQPDTAIPGEAHAYFSPHKNMIQYNWLVDQQPLNMDPVIQRKILDELMGYAAGFDRNLACNLALNFMHLYDSSWAALCWNFDSSVRDFMHRSQEDTTPFYPVTLPLSHYPVPSNGVAVLPNSITSLSLTPNPASSSVVVDYTLAGPAQTLLLIYDEIGNTVKGIVNGPRGAGQNETTVPLDDLRNGHYFVRLASGGDVVTKELIVQH